MYKEITIRNCELHPVIAQAASMTRGRDLLAISGRDRARTLEFVDADRPLVGGSVTIRVRRRPSTSTLAATEPVR